MSIFEATCYLSSDKMAEKLCKICNISVNRSKPGLKCAGFCTRFYHGKCVDIVGKELDSMRKDGVSWTCIDCRNSRPRLSIGAIPSPQHVRDDCFADSSHTLQEIRAELRQIREQQAVLLQSVNFCSDKISDFESQIAKLNDCIKKTDQVHGDNKRLRSDLETLQAKFNDLEQVSRINNIEIQGIPERKDENLIHVVEKIGEYIDFKVNPSIIDYTHRVQAYQNSPNKVKNIIVRFVSRGDRNRFLLAAKTKRIASGYSPKMTLSGVSDEFYINEHLTVSNKILYKQVRLAAKEKQYKYVWVKNGTIFCRKSDSSNIKVIRDVKSLEGM